MTPAEIREARQTLGLSQAEFAASIGYGHGHRVSELERGVRSPSRAGEMLIQRLIAEATEVGK